MSIQYAGGTNVDTTYTADGTQQALISAIEDAMNTAGWTTLSGHHGATIVLQSASTPNSNSICARLKTTANNCATIELLNAAANQITAASYLLPTNGVNYRFMVCRYQVFIFVPGSVISRYTVQFGVPYVPPFLASSIVGECGWIKGDNTGDAGQACQSFRTALGVNSAYAKSSIILNGTVLNIQSNTPTGNVILLYPQVYGGGTLTRQWHDGSYLLWEPYLLSGITGTNDTVLIRGQLWDSIIVGQQQVADATYTIDGHTFRVFTIGDNTGSLLVRSNA